MFEPGTSKNTYNCLSPKNSVRDGNIAKKDKGSAKKATKKGMIEDLVSEAADRLNLQYMTNKKKPKGVQNETTKKRKSCGSVLEKPKLNKRQRLSCEARICSEEGEKVVTEGLLLNNEELSQDVQTNDYLMMVNKQLKALQELPIIQKSSTSVIQDFILKLDESQVENFLRKKADGIQSSAERDPNAKSILSFIQKKIILPVYQNRSSIEVEAPSSRGDDLPLADSNNDICSKKVEEAANSKIDTQEVLVNPECPQQDSDESALKSKTIEADPTNNDSVEVTSTSVLEGENEITSSTETNVNQSNVPENTNSRDLFKLTINDFYEFAGILFSSNNEETNSEFILRKQAEVMNLNFNSETENKSSAIEIKNAIRNDIKKFFDWLISFTEMIKTCTDVFVKKDSEEKVKPKKEKAQGSSSTIQTEQVIKESSNKTLIAHCKCCSSKSKENNSEEVNSPEKMTKQCTNERESSNLLSVENNASTSKSPETTPKTTDILSTTTPNAQITSPVTSSLSVIAKVESKTFKDENLIDDVSDGTVVISEDEESNGEVFKCKKCDYTTKNRLKLKRHVKYAKKNPAVYHRRKKSLINSGT